MYKAPDNLKQLQKDLRQELNERNLNKNYASLITEVELGFELLHCLGLDDEPVVVLWVVLSGTPVRHPRLQNLSAAQRRAIANTRILLPGYAGRYGWETALRDYIGYIPTELRCYDLDPSRLDQQIVNACQTTRGFLNRTLVYRQCLADRLPFKQSAMLYASSGQTYDFRGRTAAQPEQVFQVEFNETQTDLVNTPLRWFSQEPRERQPFTISFEQLREVAEFLDKQEGNNRWINRLEQIDYRHINDLAVKANSITLEGMISLVGMVSSGKSTFSTLLAAYLVYESVIKDPHQSTPRRITLEVGDSASSIHLADQLNRWFNRNPEVDTPMAVPLVGWSTREKHLRQLYESREYRQAVQAGRIHWGERFLNPTCPLQGLLIGKLNQPLIPGTEPCRALKKTPAPGEPVGQQRPSYKCPLFAICPAQQIYRDMVDAQVWITTPGAMGAGTLPPQLEPRRIKIGDLVYEQSDLVVFDEVDTVIEWFDRLYAQEARLITGGDGILDKLDRQTAEVWSRDRLLSPQMRRWVEAQRNFITPIAYILALVQRHPVLQVSIERGYFTARSLLYRFTRRLLGLKDFEDDQDDHVRKANEQLVNYILPVFEELLQSEDPLRYPVPDHFRVDRRVTLTTLRRRRDALDRSSPGSDRRKAQQAYQLALEHLAYQLANIMQETMNTGDSTQHPIIQHRYQHWITQLMPDVEKWLDKLRQRLTASSNQYDQRYLQEDGVDTLETLSLRLEFAINVALLDRHNRIVFYEWHNRPEVIEGEQPYQRIPDTLLNILPLPPTGRLFGIYHTSRLGNGNSILSTFGYTNVGRSYVTNFPNLRTDLEDQPGPHVLAMSGTSYLPDSTRWHLDVLPQGILKSSAQSVQALADPNCWFKFMPVYNDQGAPIRISGKRDKRTSVHKMATALVGGYSDQGGRLGDELRDLVRLAQLDPDKWADRARLLLLVNSYDQCEWAAEIIKARWVDKAGQVYYLVRTDVDNDEDVAVMDAGKLGRIDVEMFAQTDGLLLIAPLQAVGRGLNILNAHRKAAFGTVYFLTRPMPHPEDIPAIAQEINRRAFDWYSDENFVAWQQGDGVYQRGVELRRRAAEYWGRVESRKYYAQLRDEKDRQDLDDDFVRLHANPRRDLAATTAGKIIQAVGRLVRGDVPFHAYFVDSAWAPRQAKRLKGEEIEPDTPKTSLLAAIIDVMADYVADPIGYELYQSLFNKLELTINFDWMPTD